MNTPEAHKNVGAGFMPALGGKLWRDKETPHLRVHFHGKKSKIAFPFMGRYLNMIARPVRPEVSKGERM